MRFIAIALLGLAFQEEPWTPFNDTANKHHPERVALIDVHHYDIRVKLDDAKSGVVQGETTITFAPLETTPRVELDLADVKVKSVKCERPVTFKQGDETLALDFKGGLEKGKSVSVTVGYDGKPRHGMFWIEPEKAYPHKRWMVWTQGETQYARHWFPGYDHPNDRATWEIRATYPAKYTSISNGERVGREDKDGWRTDHWKQAQPATTYLVSLIVGDFETVTETCEVGGRKVPLEYHVPRGLHADADVRRTFGRTAAMVKHFSELTGVPYPWPKYAQTVVQDFIWGGMENVSATTLHEHAVIAAREGEDRDSEGLIAHELAHQWFGDYVTSRDWSHIWLNEGFATYFEALWLEHSAGPDAATEMMHDEAGWYFGQMNDYSRPVVCDVYTHPDDVFDAWAYPKGAWVLHMLRKTVGDEAWWKGVRLFLTKHALQSVGTKEFQAAMEEAYGKPLDWFFDQWLHRTGHPEFEVHTEWRGKEGVWVTVEQKQALTTHRLGAMTTGTPVFKTFADIEITMTTATATVSKTTRVWIEKAKEEFRILVEGEPRVVEFDPDGWLLKTVRHVMSDAQLLRMVAQNDEAVGRAWAAEQLGKLARPPEGVVAALTAALNDPSTWVARAAAEALGGVGTTEARKALLEAKVERPKVREAVLHTLGALLPDADVWKRLKQAAEEDASLKCRAAAAAAMGKAQGASYDALARLAEKYADEPSVLPGVLSGVAESGDPRAAAMLAKHLKYGRHPWVRERAVQCLGRVASGKDPATRDEAAVAAFVALLNDPSYRVRRAVVEALGQIGDARAVVPLEKRLAKETDYRMAKEIREAIRRLRAPRR